jgi:hypothetical protein
MKKSENFIVKKPYQPTEDEKKAIAELKAKGLETGDWGSQKKGIKSFKNNMREHMYLEQNYKCAYCRIYIPAGCCNLDREHIVPKSLHPQWMFEPRNLCFACNKCNEYKNDEEVLSNPKRKNYPSNKEDFLIVNPFLDVYSDNIEIVDDIIYKGKTEKGKFTIKTCNLSRVELAYERAKIRIDETKDPESVQALVLSLLSNSPDIEKVKQELENIVKKYKIDNED